MSRRVEVMGRSGKTYAFTRLEGEAFLRQIGVTYVIAVESKGRWEILDAGETNNLAEGSWRPVLEAARSAHPAADCLIRLNVSRSVREAELADIAPVANGQPAGEGTTGSGSSA